MTIFQILKKDHEKVATLLEKLEKTTGKQAERRMKLFEQFRREMIVHARCEEQAVYSPIRAKKSLHDLTLEAVEEHALVDHLLIQLDAMDKSSETWGAKMTVLKEIIEHHVEEEEGDMFKKMRKACNAVELKEMAAAMTSLKKRAKLSLVEEEPATEEHEAA